MEEEEEEHYYRLICLVVDIGTEVMLKLFTNSIHPNQTLEAFLNSKMNIINGLRRGRVLNDLHYNALTVVPIDMSKFDISLLYVLITNLTNVPAPIGGWNTQALSPSDQSAGALLIRFREKRNTAIAHRPNGKLKKSEFEKHWRETEGILVGLAGEVGHAEQAAVQQNIKDAKVKQLVKNPKCEENALAIWKLQEDYSDLAATVDQMKQKVEECESMKGDVTSLKSSIDALELQMKGLENRISQTDDEATKVDQRLDHVSAEMKHLKCEVQKIESSLQEHKTEVQNRFEKVEQRQDHVSAAVQKNESSIQELGTDIQKVDQRLGHVSAVVHKNESSLQELGTDIQMVDQQLGHVSAVVQKNESSLQELGTDVQKVDQRHDHLSAAVQRNESSLQKAHVSAAVQNNESSLQELGNDVQKVDQQLGHVSAVVQKNESRLQELGTDVHKVDQQLGHVSAVIQKNESSLQELGTDIQKIDQQLGHMSAAVQDLGTDVQKREQHGKASQRRLVPGDKAYDKIKQNLRKEIIDHYRRINCCKTAIPALIKGRKTDVNEVFVMPLMRVVETGTSTSSPNKDTGKQPKYIRRIHEMFISEGEAIGKVYLRGEAGTGKTTLCQKMLSLWCNVHTSQQTENKTDEEKFLKNIELLFYIPLRIHITSDIIEMIKKDVVRDSQYDDLDLVLKTESKNCLIILDGLDEWTPLPDCRHEVPYIDPRVKFTVLTTSRPWKLEVLRPEMCDLGQIELCKLDQDHLIEAVVKLLNSRSGNTVDWKCFKYTDESGTFWHKVEKETYKKIQHLADIPVILTAMVCMWHDGEEIGTTRIQAYGKMVEYLMNFAVKRNPMMGEPSTMKEPQKSIATELVDVFKGYPRCEMHSDILSKLSDLAYHTLFNTKKENSLVFPHFVTEMYNLTEGDVKFCLNIGLLSQSEFYGKAASDMKCISFLHKTYQEFFAAIFIAHGGKKLLPPMKTLNDVFEMAEVLRFVSGLRPDWIGEINHHIAELTDRDDRILKYRTSFKEEYENKDIVERVQTIIRDCIVEVPTDRKLGCKVDLYDVIYEQSDGDSSIDTCTTIIPYLNTEHIKSLRTDKNVYNWLDRVGHNLVMLFVWPESAEDMQRVVSVIDRCSSSLSVVSVYIDLLSLSSVTVDNFITSLYRIIHLTCFKLKFMEVTHSGIEDLVRFLSTSTQLREINVSDITCTTCGDGQCEYTIDLSHHIDLEYLCIADLDGDFVLSSDTPLEYCEIRVKCGPSIVNRLRSSTTLQELSVRSNMGQYTGTTGSTTVNTHNQGVVHPPPACLSTVLTQVIPTLMRALGRTTVNTQNQGVVHPPPACLSTVLTQVIPTLMNLRTLCLWYIDFKQDILRLSPEMTSLEKVELWYSIMTLQCVQGFIDRLPQTECRVEMVDVTICPRGDVSTAVKYITDRHQVPEHWIGPNILGNGKIYLNFTNRQSHSR